MSRYRYLILFIVILLTGWVIVPYTFPETFTVRHILEIDAPARTLFAQVSDLRNWELWSPWNAQDQETRLAYKNGGIGRGGTAEWISGEKEQLLQQFTIVKSEPHTLVETGMDFRGKGFVVSAIQVSPQGEKTLLTWNSGMKTHGWSSVFFWFDFRKSIRKATGNLRETAELWHAQNILVVERGILSAFPYVSIRRQIPWEDLSDAMGNMYEELIRESGEDTYTIIGHAYAVYHSMGDEKIDIECGFPVERATQNRGIILAGVFPESDCALTEYTGTYENLEKGHDAVQQWIQERGFSLAGPPVEIFVTGASSGSDPSEWVTKICYPVILQE